MIYLFERNIMEVESVSALGMDTFISTHIFAQNKTPMLIYHGIQVSACVLIKLIYSGYNGKMHLSLNIEKSSGTSNSIFQSYL